MGPGRPDALDGPDLFDDLLVVFYRTTVFSHQVQVSRAREYLGLKLLAKPGHHGEHRDERRYARRDRRDRDDGYDRDHHLLPLGPQVTQRYKKLIRHKNSLASLELLSKSRGKRLGEHNQPQRDTEGHRGKH